MTLNLASFKALSFDCYGTLIDWESGIWDAMQPLLMHNRCLDVPRARGLALFARHEHREQTANPAMPYPDILARVHWALAAELKLASNAEMDRDFGHSLPHWPAFADSADALRRLQRHYKLVILSNVHRAGFAASKRKLGVEFDAIYTAEDVGSYKPSPANFRYLLEQLDRDLNIAPGELLHTAQSLHHDHVQARAFGLANAWIDRQRLSTGGDWGATAKVSQRPSVDFLYFTLEEMAAAVEAAEEES